MNQVSGTNTKQPTYDAAIKKTFSRITQRPSRQDRDELMNQVEHVLVEINVSSFEWSCKHGLLTEVRPATGYHTLSGKDHVEPSDN